MSLLLEGPSKTLNPTGLEAWWVEPNPVASFMEKAFNKACVLGLRVQLCYFSGLIIFFTLCSAPGIR